MDPASIPSVPLHVELAIYGYFVLVAAIGCYLNGRLWLDARANPADSAAGEDGSGANP